MTRLEGVFETLRIRAGQPWQAHRHEARMRQGAEHMGVPFPQSAWAKALQQVGDMMLRIDLDADGSLRTTSRAFTPHPEAPISVITSGSKLEMHPWRGAKPAQMPVHQAAKEEAGRAGADDALLACGDRVAEATTANVFAWIEGRCYAPGPQSGAVGGIARQVLLPDDVIEPLPVGCLGDVEAMALTNVRGVRIVGTLDGRLLEHKPALELRHRFEAAL